MSMFFKNARGVLMFEPDPTAGSAVTRKATDAEIASYEDHEKKGAIEPPNFMEMTKESIEQWALDNLGKNMNTRETKVKMVERITGWLKE